MDSIYRKDLLTGKHAVITGGGSGIGLEIGKSLVAHGAKIAIFGRNLERLEKASSGFPPHTCHIFQCDIRKSEELKSVIESITKLFTKIDILINNAAGNFLAPFSKLSTKGFRTVLEIDTIGTFAASKEVFEQSMSRHGGVIINISSTLQIPCVYMQSHASAAKAAIDSLTRSLALELGPKGVRVNGIAPGATEGTEGLSRLTPQGGPKAESYIPLQRLGTCKEIAEGVLYLISAQYTTGHTLVLDGGMTLSFPNFTLMYPEVFSSWRSKL
jgi:2,4-dienoyl-CoA reductase [(3E)-enoyl-CoA-producing], peroxisomal